MLIKLRAEAFLKSGNAGLSSTMQLNDIPRGGSFNLEPSCKETKQQKSIFFFLYKNVNRATLGSFGSFWCSKKQTNRKKAFGNITVTTYVDFSFSWFLIFSLWSSCLKVGFLVPPPSCIFVKLLQCRCFFLKTTTNGNFCHCFPFCTFSPSFNRFSGFFWALLTNHVSFEAAESDFPKCVTLR